MKFRKHIAVILALFILMMDSSFGLVYHYCHDQIAYVAFKFQEQNLVDSANEDSCCLGKDFTDEENGCCKNEEIKIEKKDIFQLAKNFDFQFVGIAPAFQVFHFETKQEFISLKQTLDYYVESNAPPIYKLNSQFIFYA